MNIEKLEYRLENLKSKRKRIRNNQDLEESIKEDDAINVLKNSELMGIGAEIEYLEKKILELQ